MVHLQSKWRSKKENANKTSVSLVWDLEYLTQQGKKRKVTLEGHTESKHGRT